uniref:Uncharacterized protein n=1 Tax=Arundo donax TaxID=35708 RepID=A0A0A9EIH4_ARUDO
MADEGLRDDVDPVERDPLEDGRPHDAPQLLRLHPPLHRRLPHSPLRRRRPSAAPLQQRRRPRCLLHDTAPRSYIRSCA